MSERKNLLAICGATVCGLILMTCTLLPATTNGASTEDLLPLADPRLPRRFSPIRSLRLRLSKRMGLARRLSQH